MIGLQLISGCPKYQNLPDCVLRAIGQRTGYLPETPDDSIGVGHSGTSSGIIFWFSLVSCSNLQVERVAASPTRLGMLLVWVSVN
jgi:hypothetical protein